MGIAKILAGFPWRKETRQIGKGISTTNYYTTENSPDAEENSGVTPAVGKGEETKTGNVIVFDTETCGLSPDKNGIIALGAVNLRTGETFYETCRVDPGTIIDPRALAVNGFKEHEAKDPTKETTKELIEHFIAWCKAQNATTLAGYNVEFDLRFLAHAMFKYGIDWQGNLPMQYVDAAKVYMEEVYNNASPDVRSALRNDIINEWSALPIGSKAKLDFGLKSMLKSDAGAGARLGLGGGAHLSFSFTNAQFKSALSSLSDEQFKDAMFAAMGENKEFSYKIMQLAMSYSHIVKMDEAVGSYGIPSEPWPHNALRGAEYCAELISLMQSEKHLEAVRTSAVKLTPAEEAQFTPSNPLILDFKQYQIINQNIQPVNLEKHATDITPLLEKVREKMASGANRINDAVGQAAEKLEMLVRNDETSKRGKTKI